MRGLHVTTMMLLQVLNILFGGAEVTSFFVTTTVLLREGRCEGVTS